MWQYQSDQWEREESEYLIHTLFEDIPLLSPIQEEQEPRSSLSLINGNLKPDSPLPDLNIEIEQKKPNLCDETEEFYEKLKKEMRRLYKRDHFSATYSTDSLESFKNFEGTEAHFKILTELSSSDGNSSVVLQELENIGDHTKYNKIKLNERESACKRKHENIIEEYGTSSSEENFDSHKKIHSEQIQIPYDKNVEDANEVTSQHYSRIITTAEGCNKSKLNSNDENTRHESDVPLEGNEEEEEEEGAGGEKEEEEEDDEEEEEDGEEGEEEEVEEEEEKYESLAINCGASRVMNNSEKERQFSPEMMRQAHHSTSIESLLVPGMSTSDPDGIGDKSIDIQPTEMEEAILSYGPNEVPMSQSPLNIIPITSTPKSVRKSKMVTRRYSNRSSPYTPSPHSHKNVSGQASFSDRHPDPPQATFWSQFFVGTSTIYKLCSCKDHTCS